MNRTVEKGHLASEPEGGRRRANSSRSRAPGAERDFWSWTGLGRLEERREGEKGRSEACPATRLWGGKQARPGLGVEAAFFSQDEEVL